MGVGIGHMPELKHGCREAYICLKAVCHPIDKYIPDEPAIYDVVSWLYHFCLIKFIRSNVDMPVVCRTYEIAVPGTRRASR